MIRALNALALMVAAVLAVALYIAKTEAQGSQERLVEIQAQLAEERRQINVLNVEIAHLEDPERLRVLARRYLGFEPLDPAREVEMVDVPLLIEPDRPRPAGNELYASEAERLAVPVQTGGRP